MRIILYAIFLLYVLFARSAAALNDPWSVNINDHAAVQRTYKQGESWTMQVSVRDGLKPLDLTGATAKFYWYTNTVQNIWWTNSAAIPAPKAGLVTAQWTPAMDCGAASYPYWFGIWMPGNTSPLWRVTGTIRMLTSPGFKPNEQTPPVRTLDFSAITITNAPWVTASDWASGSNALASALMTVSGIASGAAAQAESNRQSIAALPPPSTDALRLVNPTNATEWTDGAGNRYRITDQVTTNADQLLIYDSTMSSYGVRVMNRIGSSDQWTVGTHDYDLINAGDIYSESGFIVQGWEAGMEFMWTLLASPYDLTSFPKTYAHASNGHTGWVDRVVSHQVSTQALPRVAFVSDIAAIPPPSTDALRLVSTNAPSWIDGDGAVWGLVTTTNLVVTFSPDFSTEDGHRPPQQSYPFPFIDAGFDCFQSTGYIALMYYPDYEYEAQWANNGLTIPARLDPLYNGTGYAIVDYQVVTARVDAVALKSDLQAFPTNYIAGFVLPIPGTNVVYTLSVDSNRTLSVWEVVP